MSKWWVAYIVRKANCFHKVGVDPKCALELRAHAAAYLRYLERVGQPCTIEVALTHCEHLRLALQSPKCCRMDYSSFISFKRRSALLFGGFTEPPLRVMLGVGTVSVVPIFDGR